MPIRIAIAFLIFAITAFFLLPFGLAWAESGIASYYGPGFHGRKTASGQRFNMNAMTCAHRTAKFGSHLRVTNLKTGRSIVCLCNDRGPFVRGRVIDLSRAAARALGMGGLAHVSITRLN